MDSRASHAAGVAKYFDRLAGEWGGKYDTSYLFRMRQRAIEAALAKYAGQARLALDYGCGSGALTPLLAAVSNEVHATDLSAQMRDAAARRLADTRNVTVFELAKLPPGPYDLVLCSSVIEYVEDDAELIARFSNLMSPRGLLVVTFANRLGVLQNLNRILPRPNEYLKHQKRRYGPRDVRRLLGPSFDLLELATPVGLPGARELGAGELLLAVARRRA